MRIVKDDGVPQGYAMEVRLKRSNGEEDDQQRSGMGYSWNPRQLAAAVSACLSYSIWLPQDFNFGSGGALPGFVSTTERSDFGLTPEDYADKRKTSEFRRAGIHLVRAFRRAHGLASRRWTRVAAVAE